MSAEPATEVIGVLLAGGLSRRMGGGDKCLSGFGETTLLGRAIGRARPQVAALVLSANGDPDRFADFDVPVVTDAVSGFVGPLAGVLTGMEWAMRARPNARWIATFATDAPFFPRDLVARFVASLEGGDSDLARAASAGRAHPVFGLWPVNLAGGLRRALTEEGLRKIDIWTARYRMCDVSFATEPVDPFFNVNDPPDLEHGQAMLAVVPEA